jgi:DMSO reductase anchor subunit
MVIIVGEIIFFAGILYFCMILLAARNPRQKGWFAAPGVVGTVHIFSVMGFLIIGLSMMIKTLTIINSINEMLLPAAIFVVLLTATTLIVKSMHIKERLAAYDALRKNAEVIDIAPASPPDRGTDGHSPLQKAA